METYARNGREIRKIRETRKSSKVKWRYGRKGNSRGEGGERKRGQGGTWRSEIEGR